MNTVILILLIILLLLLMLITKKVHEHFCPRSLNYDMFYKHNRDLDYVAHRHKFKVSGIENIRTQQIAPIMGQQNNMQLTSLWGSAILPNDYPKTSNRIPDKYSTLTKYNHPIVRRI